MVGCGGSDKEETEKQAETSERENSQNQEKTNTDGKQSEERAGDNDLNNNNEDKSFSFHCSVDDVVNALSESRYGVTVEDGNGEGTKILKSENEDFALELHGKDSSTEGEVEYFYLTLYDENPVDNAKLKRDVDRILEVVFKKITTEYRDVAVWDLLRQLTGSGEEAPFVKVDYDAVVLISAEYIDGNPEFKFTAKQ